MFRFGAGNSLAVEAKTVTVETDGSFQVVDA